MNERIRELVKQAGVNLSSFQFSGTPTKYEVAESELEKFAELIVEKCVKCSDPLISHYINNHTEQDQAMLLAAIADYSSEIMKYFGIKNE